MLLLGAARGVAFDQPLAPAAWNESCAVCHVGWKEFKEWETSVHARSGVSCSSCHGGDVRAGSMDEVRASPGFVGKVPRTRVPELCARCHSDAALMRQYKLPTDQLEEYRLSAHGRRLAQGDDRVAVCSDCHGAHAVLPASDPRSPVNKFKVPATCGRCHGDAALMAEFGLPADTYAAYAAGIHGELLLKQQISGVPHCADCHGNHGAAPPGVSEVVNVCGTCHVNQRENYLKSPHARSGAAKEVCVNCHGNHQIRKPDETLYLGTYRGACGSCHGRGTGEYKRAEVIASYFKDAKDSVAAARARVEAAKHATLPVDAWLQQLDEAEAKITEAYPVAHSLDAGRVSALTKEAVSAAYKVELAVKEANRERAHRRTLALWASAATLLFVLLLAVKRAQLFKNLPDVASGS